MTSRAGLPGSLTRLRRDPLAIVALVFVALLATASAGIHQTATTRVASTVDAHWRGAYDILVRRAATRLDLERTNGLVEPNFVGFAGSGGISLDQLTAIRNIDGVELAAPIAFVGYLRDVAPSVVLEIDHLPTKPTLYRVSITTTTSDGLSRQLVQHESGKILLGPAQGNDPTINWATDLGDLSANRSPDGKWVIDIVTKRNLPGLAVPIIAVDPVAESKLLGGANFLDALAAIGSDSRTAGTFDIKAIDPAHRFAASQLDSIQSPGWPFQSDRQLPVIPLVVSSRQAADLTTELTVEQLGHVLDAYPTGGLGGADAAAGTEVTSAGSTSVDAGATLAPLRAPSLCVRWPGFHSACEVGSFFRTSSLDSRLVVRPSYSAASTAGPDAGAPAYTIARVGVVNPDGDPTTPDFRPPDTAESGQFPAYRALKSVPLAVSKVSFAPHANVREPFVLAPVGSFDATAVKVPSDPLNYVPLGAYDPADTTFIADPHGAPAVPTTMNYPLLPNGLVTTPPLAITDLAGAQVLRGDSPIDAVRVRVAVTDFSSASQSRIEVVANAIKRLGFDVDIVAGSSPQAVDLYVPAYHVDQNPAADLGWVRQHWTTIGAAVRIIHGFYTSDLALLVLSIVAAAIWAVALAALRVERRARDAAILSAIGWSRREVAQWLSSEAVVGAVVIVIFGFGGFVLGSGSLEALGTAAGMAALWLIAGVLASLDAIRRARPSTLGAAAGQPRLAGSVPVDGLVSYALRAALGRWPWVCVIAAGLGAATSAISLGIAIVAGLTQRIGPTLLASATGAAAEFYQPLMLGAVGLGSLAFVGAALRLDRRRRAPEALVLSVSGWSSGEIRALLWAGLVPVAVLAASIAVAMTVALAGPFEIASTSGAVLLATGLALSVLVWGGALSRGVVAAPGDL